MDHTQSRSASPSASIICFMALLAFVGSFAPAHADVVHLKRGGSLEGEVVEGKDTIEVRLKGGSTTFNRSEVERIDKADDGGRSKNPALNTLSVWSSGTSAWFNRTRLGAIKHWNGVQKSTSGWFKPVGKSDAAKLKEKKLNDSLMEMQRAQKKLHEKEKAEARAKRALKKDGFNIS